MAYIIGIDTSFITHLIGVPIGNVSNFIGVPITPAVPSYFIVGGSFNTFKKPTTKKRVVKESYASKPVATTAPSAKTISTQVLSEGFEMAERWKKLAGLL